MRAIIFSLAILLIGPTFICNKKIEIPASGCFKGKLEAIPNCGAPVVKILEGDLSKINHMPSWTQLYTGLIFTNVFTVENYCYPGERNISEGEEFYFILADNPGRQDCIICAAAIPVPPEKNIIKIISADLCR